MTKTSNNLKRLAYFYGSPDAAEKATGLPKKYFVRVPGLYRHRDCIAADYQHLLDRAIAELDGVFEIKLSLELHTKAEELAAAQGISVRDLVQAEAATFLNEDKLREELQMRLETCDVYENSCGIKITARQVIDGLIKNFGTAEKAAAATGIPHEYFTGQHTEDGFRTSFNILPLFRKYAMWLNGRCEVSIDSLTAQKIEELAAETGLTPCEFVADIIRGYFEE